MPLTTLYGDGTRIVGDANAIEQTLHPTVMNYVNIIRSSTGGNYAMSVNEIDAVNNMVQALVSNGIWTKLLAIYPIIGTTAAAHKFNLKDPRDADAAYRLSFLGGGWTHSSNGATPNGTTSYADTFLAGNVLAQNSGHLSYYSRSNTAGGAGVFKVEMGYVKLTPSVISTALILLRDNATIGAINTATLATTGQITNTQGFYIANRISATVNTLFKNGALQITSNDNSVAPSTINIWIGARNSPDNIAARNYTDRQCAFASIGSGLTEGEAKSFSTIVQTFQTKLGRQV